MIEQTLCFSQVNVFASLNLINVNCSIPQPPCAWCGEAAGGAASSWRSEATRGARQVGGNVLQVARRSKPHPLDEARTVRWRAAAT
eukprot:COSAG06_NODE_1775_length_8426_cov_4.369761_7_plen_86_part_00